MLDPNLLTAAGLILAVLLAYMQIQKTHKKNISAQREHLRNELRVSLYEKASAVFQNASSTIAQAENIIRSAIMTLDMMANGVPLTPRTTVQDTIHTHSGLSEAVSQVLRTLEQYEIAFSRFQSFRREFSDSHKAALNAHVPLFAQLSGFIPTEHHESSTLGPRAAPTKDDVKRLKALADTYLAAAGDLQGYIIDLQIEAQNELLGDPFEHQLPPRAPGDESVRVLARDPEKLRERPRGRLA
jgi:hypothetical protein